MPIFKVGGARNVRDCSEAAEACRRAGFEPVVHPHAGTYIETRDETRRVLDAIERLRGLDVGSWRGREFSGERIRVALNGKVYIDLVDAHIAGPGAVGLWTKADSVTAFDDFGYGSLAR